MLKTIITVYHESFKAENFHGCLHVCETFYVKVQDGTVQIWVKEKYERFRKSCFTKVYVYNLPQNFSALKLSWYTIVPCAQFQYKKEYRLVIVPIF